MTSLRDGSVVSDPRLDRLVYFDPTSRTFPVRHSLGADQQSPVTKLWTLPATSPVLDQGPDGACVGFGVTNELRFYPVPVRGLDAVFAKQRIYWEAQRIDEWAGGDYPGADPAMEGTSVLAGVRIARRLGYITEYRWAFGERDLALAVSHLGPCVLGLAWWSDMMAPDAKGFLHRRGEVRGGHCVLCIGVNVRSRYYTIYNSWGPDWGAAGRAKISFTDMAALLADDGEAVLPTGRAAPTA